MRSHILAVVDVKVVVFCDMTPCSLLPIFQSTLRHIPEFCGLTNQKDEQL